MLASDEHKRRKKEFGSSYKPKIGDFMKIHSFKNLFGGSGTDTGGTGGDDPDPKENEGSGGIDK